MRMLNVRMNEQNSISIDMQTKELTTVKSVFVTNPKYTTKTKSTHKKYSLLSSGIQNIIRIYGIQETDTYSQNCSFRITNCMHNYHTMIRKLQLRL